MIQATKTGAEGRLLAYATDTHLSVAVNATAAASTSGIVVRGRDPRSTVLQSRQLGCLSVVVPDVGAWTSEVATTDSPTVLTGAGSLFDVSLDSWARPLLAAESDAVLTPSKFVRLGDWPALQAVLRAGECTELENMITLVATDAGMLDPPYLATFTELVDTGRPLSFIFADKSRPFGSYQRKRMCGLRHLLSSRPGCFLLASEPVVVTDAFGYGISGAAIGISGSTRQPRRPDDPAGGGNNAQGFLPGLFLRDLWEHRSPDVYADWYANSPSPLCSTCDRALDVFDRTEVDKAAILRHNVHAWLDVFEALRSKTPGQRRAWSVAERLRALTAHLDLAPTSNNLEADSVLRQLIELDDGRGRRTTPQGALR